MLVALKTRYRLYTIVGFDFCLELCLERSRKVLKVSWSFPKLCFCFSLWKNWKERKYLHSHIEQLISLFCQEQFRACTYICMMNLFISIFIMKTSDKDQSNVTAVFVTICNVSQSPDFLTKVALFRVRPERYNSWDNNYFLAKKWMSPGIYACWIIVIK